MTFSFDTRKSLDFIAMGRLCIDLNANEIHRPMEETMTFTKYVGGSPANIVTGLARLGMKTGFIGRVADDQMGRYILQYLEKNGIDTRHVVTDTKGSVTGLSFTEIKSPSNCSILMYRDNVADLRLAPQDVDEDYIKTSKTLLISGTALAKSPSREAIFLALHYARKHGVTVFFDLDYRPYTWSSPEETAIYYHLAAEKSDCIIGTREEFAIMDGFEQLSSEEDAPIKKWFGYKAEIVVVKHGAKGSKAYVKGGDVFHAKTFPADIVKTFGAGDAYAASFIYGLLNGFPIERAMEYGSAAASIVISSHSCSDAMPTVEQVERMVQGKVLV